MRIGMGGEWVETFMPFELFRKNKYLEDSYKEMKNVELRRKRWKELWKNYRIINILMIYRRRKRRNRKISICFVKIPFISITPIPQPGKIFFLKLLKRKEKWNINSQNTCFYRYKEKLPRMLTERNYSLLSSKIQKQVDFTGKVLLTNKQQKTGKDGNKYFSLVHSEITGKQILEICYLYLI